MLETGPQGFLLGHFVCLRGGPRVLYALASEEEYLGRCGVWPLPSEPLGLGAGIQVALLCAKRGADQRLYKGRRGKRRVCLVLREGPAPPPWGAQSLFWLKVARWEH